MKEESVAIVIMVIIMEDIIHIQMIKIEIEIKTEAEREVEGERKKIEKGTKIKKEGINIKKGKKKREKLNR